MSLTDVAGYIGAISVIGGFVMWTVSKARRGYQGVREWYLGLTELMNQFKPNGGKSVMDKLNRIDLSVQIDSARIMAMMNHAAHPVFECNAEGKCILVNKAICDLFGLSPEEMLGTGWLNGVSPEDRESTIDSWMSAIAKSIPYEHRYNVRNARTGVLTPVRAFSAAMKNVYGQIIGFHGTVQPITGHSHSGI